MDHLFLDTVRESFVTAFSPNEKVAVPAEGVLEEREVIHCVREAVWVMRPSF